MNNSQPIIDELIKRYPILEPIENDILNAVKSLQECYISEGKLLVCGNGGSAADSEHIVGELMKSFRTPRKLDAAFIERYLNQTGEQPPQWLEGALPAIALVSHPALSTAFANDNSAVGIFAQQVYGLGCKKDILMCISTSGNSENTVEAAKVAKAKGMRVISLTGSSPSRLSALSDITIKAPQTDTYKIQELHLPIYHAICAALEASFFGDTK